MVDMLDGRVRVLEDDMKEIKGTCNDISLRLVRIEETLKNNKDNTVDFKTYNKTFMELSTCVKLLTERVGEVISKIDKQNERINKLENYEGNKAKKILTWLGTTVGALVIGTLAGIIMNGGI